MPIFTTIDYEALVHEMEGTDADEVELHTAYQFSSKTFREDDSAGVYSDEEE